MVLGGGIPRPGSVWRFPMAAPSAHQVPGRVVALHQVVCLLGRFPALAGADLVVDAGEVVHLEGPNGAGKSTLLRLCAGLVGVSSGRAEVLGCDLAADRRAVRRRVGFLGHASGLYDELSVADNVRFAARAARAPAGSDERALARLGLGGRLARLGVARLSAGQRRRAALAAVVARQPELWLLDEPHAGLDAAGRDLLDELVAEAAAAGATVLFASHELDRAAGVATRRVRVAGGRVAGSPGTGPAATVPSATVPAATVPDATVPAATVPAATVPDATVPAATVPDATVPAATVPAATTRPTPAAATPVGSTPGRVEERLRVP